jgi:hypothetical protein
MESVKGRALVSCPAGEVLDAIEPRSWFDGASFDANVAVLDLLLEVRYVKPCSVCERWLRS